MPSWLIVSAEPLHDAGGQLEAAVVSFTDVTSHKEAELAVRRSEERFKRTFSCGPPGLVMRRGARDWEVVEVNDAFLAIGGCTRDEVVGPGASFDAREALPALLAAHESHAAVRDLEIRFAPRGGPARTLLASPEPLELVEGDSVLCFFQDITERQRAEAAVQASEARFRGIYEHAPVSIWYQDWSPVFARFDALRAEGVDVAAHLDAHPELVTELVRSIRTVDVNDRAVRLVGAASKADLLGTPGWVTASPEVPRVFKQTTALASTCATRTSCSRSSSGCTAATSSRAPASGWRSRSASSTVTAGASGRGRGGSRRDLLLHPRQERGAMSGGAIDLLVVEDDERDLELTLRALR